MALLRRCYAKLRLTVNETKSAVAGVTGRKFLGYSEAEFSFPIHLCTDSVRACLALHCIGAIYLGISGLIPCHAWHRSCVIVRL